MSTEMMRRATAIGRVGGRAYLVLLSEGVDARAGEIAMRIRLGAPAGLGVDVDGSSDRATEHGAISLARLVAFLAGASTESIDLRRVAFDTMAFVVRHALEVAGPGHGAIMRAARLISCPHSTVRELVAAITRGRSTRKLPATIFRASAVADADPLRDVAAFLASRTPEPLALMPAVGGLIASACAHALDVARGNQSRAAALLGLGESTLRRYLGVWDVSRSPRYGHCAATLASGPVAAESSGRADVRVSGRERRRWVSFSDQG